MLADDTRGKIKNITEGTILEGERNTCTTIRNLLCTSFPTSTTVKKDFESKAILKKEQANLIEIYCTANNLWLTDLPGKERYLAKGGEAYVYLDWDNRNVIKVNDGVYYATWLEFLNSILLHNLIFQNTAYNLLGFIKEQGELFAVLKQPFVISEEIVELEDIKKFLVHNGFEHTKRQDYVHKDLGLILEDMHDENVLVNSDTLFFIDTVFYTVAIDPYTS